MGWGIRIALWVVCATTYLQFAPGRILFPDDEIVYQTTRSMWEFGDLAIPGIPKRTGELEGRPSGTFGWAPGRDGRRYGFFGHPLSVAALPLYGLGKASTSAAPETWRHAMRSDHYYVHRRSPKEDWPRLFVSLTNCFITALSVVLLAEWVLALGYGPAIAVMVGLSWGLATSAWAYAGTFLSEPLSSTFLVLGGLGVTKYFACYPRTPRKGLAWLLVAAAAVVLAVHTHVLSLVAVPAYVGWVVLGLRARGDLGAQRRAWTYALVVGAVGLALLGLSHWLRFGDPWETGRYDHYSHFVWPGSGLAALVVGPGRSVFIYSPALLVALFGVRRLWKRDKMLVGFIAAVFVTRWVFVACRSDWWGGWAVGPRYLLPVVPLMLLPLAEVLERVRRHRARMAAVALALVAAGLVSMHLASHSIFEHMLSLTTTGSPEMNYLQRSHWLPEASPIAGFFGLKPDTLSHGAWRLYEHDHPGLLWVFVAIGSVGLCALAWLVRALIRGYSPGPWPRPKTPARD